MNAINLPVAANADDIATACQTLAQQLPRIVNAQGMQGQQQILDAIRTLGQRFQGVENRLQGVENRLRQIDNHLQQIDNHIIRLDYQSKNRDTSIMNAVIWKQDMYHALQLLVNVHTGQDIPGFPTTFLAFEQLNDNQVLDGILAALDIHLAPNTAAKIKKEHIRRRWIAIW